jgi:hypothetical protein
MIKYSPPRRCVGAYAYAGVCINHCRTRGGITGKYTLTRGFSGLCFAKLDNLPRTVRGYAANEGPLQ